MTDDVRKLLGGYATGTLTEEERKVLFAAALEDEQLFAALADEQALKDLLDDSTARAELLRVAEDTRFTIRGALVEWFERPKAKVLLGLAAVLVIAIAVQALRNTSQPLTQVAEIRSQRVPAVPPVEQQPEPAEAREVEAPQNQPRRRVAAPPPPETAATATPEAVRPPLQDERKEELVAAAPTPAVLGAAAPATSAPAAVAKPDQPVFTKVAGAGETQVQYELLRLGSDGTYQAVPADYAFAAEDKVRLRVIPSKAGTIAVSAEAPQHIVPVQAGQAAVVPAAGDLSVTEKLRVVFTAGSGVPLATNIAERRAFVRSDVRAKSATDAASADQSNAKVQSEVQPPLTFEIRLNRKQ